MGQLHDPFDRGSAVQIGLLESQGALPSAGGPHDGEWLSSGSSFPEGG